MADEALLELLVDGARYGDAEDVKEALGRGAAVNGADEQGRTALHMACANGHTAVAGLLLAHQADVHAQNEQGNTPLHYACLNGHCGAVRLLLERGASPAALNSHARSPVDECLGKGHQETVLAVLRELCPAGAAGEGDSEEDPELAAEDAGEEGPSQAMDLGGGQEAGHSGEQPPQHPQQAQHGREELHQGQQGEGSSAAVAVEHAAQGVSDLRLNGQS